jgi:hypothetical protein
MGKSAESGDCFASLAMTERKLAMTEEEIAMTERKLIMTDKGWPITHATRHCEETEADAAIYPSLRGESVSSRRGNLNILPVQHQ